MYAGVRLKLGTVLPGYLRLGAAMLTAASLLSLRLVHGVWITRN